MESLRRRLPADLFGLAQRGGRQEPPGLSFGLDRTTAHRELRILEDGLTIERGDRQEDTDTIKKVADRTRGRFMDGRNFAGNPAVLGDVALSRGSHYWEVDVSFSSSYRVGLALKNTPRDLFVGSNPLSWCLDRTIEEYSVRHDRIKDKIRMLGHLERLGVYVDCDSGRLAFFDAEKKSLIHDVTVDRAEPLYPAFALWNGFISVQTGFRVPDYISKAFGKRDGGGMNNIVQSLNIKRLRFM
ncbi:E3 ubiquitin-protein ligase Midline-1-like [Branchiostoma floridae]|uniref:E3 ubiquitin-protein ligase Midline-1-like n=1 Tax=Branchiostoma floridae TaxID=7739 RepID=A0A9J7N581_BRAFL|nr:E3 ubiquitin-protein ligase Midline-1-like [Branchiostoma floridae]